MTDSSDAQSVGQTTRVQVTPYGTSALGVHSKASHANACLSASPSNRTTKLRGRLSTIPIASSPNQLAGTLQPSAAMPWSTMICGHWSNLNQEKHCPATITMAPDTPKRPKANASLVRRAVTAFLSNARIGCDGE